MTLLRAQRDGAFDDAEVEAIGVRDELEAGPEDARFADPRVDAKGMARDGFDGEECATLERHLPLASGVHAKATRRREPNDASLAQLNGRELAGGGDDLGGTPPGDGVAVFARVELERYDGNDRGRGVRSPTARIERRCSAHRIDGARRLARRSRPRSAGLWSLPCRRGSGRPRAIAGYCDIGVRCPQTPHATRRVAHARARSLRRVAPGRSVHPSVSPSIGTVRIPRFTRNDSLLCALLLREARRDLAALVEELQARRA